MRDKFMRMLLFRISILFILMLTLFISCGKKKLKPTASAEERMAYAEKLFKNGDYLDAKTEYRIITLNYPGSTISDKAQYLLAECHFKLKEYIIASAEYQKLIRMFPHSNYVDDAQYKVALCNYELSPKFSLDQEYTHKAIQEFQRFMEDYPNSDLLPDAKIYMRKCREKLAKKNFKNAEAYRKMAYYQSAIIYYDYVLDNYYDTLFAQKSLLGKAQCYKKLGKNEEALQYYQLYLEKYPKGAKIKQVKDEITKLSDNSD